MKKVSAPWRLTTVQTVTRYKENEGWEYIGPNCVERMESWGGDIEENKERNEMEEKYGSKRKWSKSEKMEYISRRESHSGKKVLIPHKNMILYDASWYVRLRQLPSWK